MYVVYTIHVCIYLYLHTYMISILRNTMYVLVNALTKYLPSYIAVKM